MPDIDFNDLILEAQAELAEIVEEIMNDLTATTTKHLVAMQWAQVSPDQKEILRQTNPDAVDQLTKFIQGE